MFYVQYVGSRATFQKGNHVSGRSKLHSKMCPLSVFFFLFCFSIWSKFFGRLFYKDFLRLNVSSNWTLIDGYNTESQTTYPRRALFSGAKAGLTIDLVSYDDDLDYICGDSLQGYKVSRIQTKVLLHSQHFRYF